MSYIESLTEPFTAGSGINEINGILTRGMDVIISVSAIIIAILWIPIAMGFFSSDETRRYNAYSKAKNAAIGTLIYLMAVSGVIYGVFSFIIKGSP